MNPRRPGWLVGVTLLTGCTSFGPLGLVANRSVDPVAMLKAGRGYEEVGPAEGRACRFFLLAIVPWGDASFSTAVDRALADANADALINVAVTTSLSGYTAIYNLLGFTCTTVKGIAIRVPAGTTRTPGEDDKLPRMPSGSFSQP